MGRVREQRFYDRVMRDDELRNAIAYVHANPVKAGLCETEADWRWSTANPFVDSDLRRVVVDWHRPAKSPSGWTPDEPEV